jgi:hypothetical protein
MLFPDEAQLIARAMARLNRGARQECLRDGKSTAIINTKEYWYAKRKHVVRAVHAHGAARAECRAAIAGGRALKTTRTIRDKRCTATRVTPGRHSLQ